MWVLVLDCPKQGLFLRYGLASGKTYLVGRSPGCHIKTRGDTSMSKSHARIDVVRKEGVDRPEVVLEDSGSKFGTHVNQGSTRK